MRNYFSRREQWRLLLLVMSLGVVLIVMRELRRPENAERVAQAFAEESPAENTANKGVTLPQPSPSREGSIKPLSAGAIAAIQDNTYFRNAEKGAWFELIAALQQTDADEIESASAAEVSYVQLVDQPTAYRGKLVTVRGTARQVTRQRPAKNDLGLKSYYRLVIQPSGGDIGPIFVYALELPPSFPAGEEVAADILATGFFFKNLSYESRDGLGIAPVIAAKSVTLAHPEKTSQPLAAATRVPTGADLWNGIDNQAASEAVAKVPELREVLSLAGWNAERFGRLADNQPLSDDERKELLELLWRVRTFDAASIDAWTKADATIAKLLADPAAHQGEMVRLAGRITRAERQELSQVDAARLEMPAYTTCDIETQNGRAVVLTANVPKAWRQLATLDEPSSVSAVFVKRMHAAVGEGEPVALLVAKRVAWHPTAAGEPVVSLGESVLGTLGMDVGLCDEIRSRGAIRAEEREVFYQLLSAAGKIGANQLARFSLSNLEKVRAHWAAEAESSNDAGRRALAQEVVRRADQGRYSVAPLFNDAERQIGRLVVVDGAARRVVRVEVGSRADGGASDVKRRFGIDHYYEMEVFTDDSQNYPLVFCVRELPDGFPIGGELHVPVRVAGFFFKDWLYRTRNMSSGESSDADGSGPRSQYAPLLIGRAPLVLEAAKGEGSRARVVAAGAFVLALCGIWAAAWWYARDDRKFAERARVGFSLRPGESLNDLSLPSAEEPMK